MEGENNTNQNGETAGAQGAPVSGAGKNTLMGVLAYLGIFIIIPYLMAKNEPFVAYHIKQGLVLVVIWLAVWVLGTTAMPWRLDGVLNLINLGVFVLSIIGIVNVVQGNEKELPLVGQFSKHFNNV